MEWLVNPLILGNAETAKQSCRLESKSQGVVTNPLADTLAFASGKGHTELKTNMPTAPREPVTLHRARPLTLNKSLSTCQDSPPVQEVAHHALEEMALSSSPTRARARLIVLTDTPNLFRSTQECFGDDYLPDYASLRSIATCRGNLIAAFAFVNDGYPHHRVRALQQTGYRVLRSEGPDCDYRFVEHAIATHEHGDIFLLGGGDHRYSHLASVLRKLGKYVIVSALRSSCSRRLMRKAHEFFPFPIKQRLHRMPCGSVEQ